MKIRKLIAIAVTSIAIGIFSGSLLVSAIDSPSKTTSSRSGSDGMGLSGSDKSEVSHVMMLNMKTVHGTNMDTGMRLILTQDMKVILEFFILEFI